MAWLGNLKGSQGLVNWDEKIGDASDHAMWRRQGKGKEGLFFFSYPS
jgi:hypothetical protein